MLLPRPVQIVGCSLVWQTLLFIGCGHQCGPTVPDVEEKAFLLPVLGFTAEGLGAAHDVTGEVLTFGLKLEAELAVVSHVSTEKIVAEEVEREFLVPRRVNLDVFGVRLVAVLQQFDFASAVPVKSNEAGV